MGTSFAPNRLKPYAIYGRPYDSGLVFDNNIQKKKGEQAGCRRRQRDSPDTNSCFNSSLIHIYVVVAARVSCLAGKFFIVRRARAEILPETLAFRSIGSLVHCPDAKMPKLVAIWQGVETTAIRVVFICRGPPRQLRAAADVR